MRGAAAEVPRFGGLYVAAVAGESVSLSANRLGLTAVCGKVTW